VFEAVASAGSNGELAPVMAAGNSLLYNLKPAVHSTPSNRLAMLPVELDFRAGATAAVVPQFVQMLDGMAEQVRIWVAESRTSVHADPIADPELETESALKSEIELSPTADIPVAEPEIEAEAVPRSNGQVSPIVDIPVAEAAPESEVALGSKTELAPVEPARNPLPYIAKPSIHSGSLGTFSMFQLDSDSETGTTAIGAPRPVAMRHPIAAVGLTIALAFLVSTGIFSYMCTTRAGDILFDWGGKMWSGVSSQPISQNPAPSSSSVTDSSRPPQQ
jgi:hypothetical protein